MPRPPSARLGSHAPWEDFLATRAAPTKSSVLSSIDAYNPSSPEAVPVEGRPPSAVLVPIAGSEAAPEIVFTRRAWHLRSHTGEVSFPGGRADPEDVDLRATALRESNEEIGLSPHQVQIVGELDRLATVSSPALIVPFVGSLLGEPDLVAAPDEVDAVLRVSIAELLDPEIYRREIWPWRNPSGGAPGGEMEIIFFELAEDTLWGATARMVQNLLEVLTADDSPHG